MNSLVDVHIFRRPDSMIRSEDKPLYNSWTETCILSISSNIINIHNLEGKFTSDFLTLRKQGFEYGTSKYVSFVNDDDYVIGDPFTECVLELEQNPTLCGVYTNSFILDQHSNTKVPFFQHKEWTREFHLNTARPVHELVVIRRDVLFEAYKKIEQFLTLLEPVEVTYLTTDGEQTIYSAVASFGDWKFLPKEFGFVWRRHNQGRHVDAYSSRRQISPNRKTELHQLLLRL